MKLSLSLMFLLISLSIWAQENIPFQGKIKAENLDGTSINVINVTQQTGTISGKQGNFKIMVKENDVLLFSSIQYDNKEISVTKKMLESGNLVVELQESLNFLDEVTLKNTTLTGNLNTDIAAIKVYKLPVELNGLNVKNRYFESDVNDHQSAPVNIALGQRAGPPAGVDVLGLLVKGVSTLVGSGNSVGKSAISSDIPKDQIDDELRKIFDDAFFINGLGIKEERINDFIFFADDNGLNRQLLNDENKLDLVAFLMQQSEKYKELSEAY
ncbi:hypothetical protein L1I30_12075 [Gillisia sp. M10.2A]|uniref:CarboxypepD_reg-like domain-containing protein n=1 Tax=Gillisia lutea TaxID=2909668 RepID=A0ABS9ELS7_9FLAO|nr:hypothetical protein [Gillisia lutea]MCF4102406.1 hypothetical protein [Gillisia lutea]